MEAGEYCPADLSPRLQAKAAAWPRSTMLLTAGSCDRRLDHGKVGRHAQSVTPASQVAFRRFLRPEMHDLTEAGSKKVALHLRRLEVTEPWLPSRSVTFGKCRDHCCLVPRERRWGHHELKDKFAAGRSRHGHIAQHAQCGVRCQILRNAQHR